jgi:hypothetical protein
VTRAACSETPGGAIAHHFGFRHRLVADDEQAKARLPTPIVFRHHAFQLHCPLDLGHFRLMT